MFTANACAAGTALDSVADADGCATVAAAATTPTEAGAVAALTVTGCVEFDSFLAGVDAVCSGSGADVAGGVLGAVGSGTTTGTVDSLDGAGVSTPLVLVDELGSVVLVCAPPLLLTVTPGATSALDDVAPDVCVVPVAVVPVAVDVDPPAGVEPAPVVGVVDEAEDPGVVVPAGSPDVVLLDVELAELVDDESEDVPVVSAADTP